MKQLHASKIADGITAITFKDGVKDPYVKVDFYYSDTGVDSELSFKHEDRGHNDLHAKRRELAGNIAHLLELSNTWNLVKLQFDWADFTIKAELSRHLDGYSEPIILKTPKINDMVLDEITPLFEEAAKYVTGEKRQQADMFAEAL